MKYLRIPGRLAFHVWTRRASVVIGDRQTDHRFAIIVRGRVLLRVRA